MAGSATRPSCYLSPSALRFSPASSSMRSAPSCRSWTCGYSRCVPSRPQTSCYSLGSVGIRSDAAAPLYEQEVRGQSALAAGLLLAPQGLGMLLTRGYAGRLTDRIGARPIVLVGFLLTMAGTLAYTQAGVNTNELLLGASLVVRGAGLGAVTIPVMAGPTWA